MRSLENWFEQDTVTRKREDLAKLLVKLINENKQNENIVIPDLKFSTKNGKLKTRKRKQPELKKIGSQSNKRSKQMKKKNVSTTSDSATKPSFTKR